MAFCTKCGTQLTDGAKFCIFCGSSVEGTVSEPKPETKEKLNAVKEKVNTGISKLPFKKLAEDKIPAGARAKFPLLGKAIPFANYIACALAVVLVITVITVSVKKEGGGGRSNEMFFYYNEPQSIHAFLNDYLFLSYYHMKNGVFTWYRYVHAKHTIVITMLGYEYHTPKIVGKGTYKRTKDDITISYTSEEDGETTTLEGTIDENAGLLTLSNGSVFTRVKSLQSVDMEGTYLWD